MTFTTRRLALALALAGAGIAGAVQPASAFFGSFSASCHAISVYGGGAYMTATCRRADGSWHFTRISNCGGFGVHNDDGHLRCGA